LPFPFPALRLGHLHVYSSFRSVSHPTLAHALICSFAVRWPAVLTECRFRNGPLSSALPRTLRGPLPTFCLFLYFPHPHLAIHGFAHSDRFRMPIPHLACSLRALLSFFFLRPGLLCCTVASFIYASGPLPFFRCVATPSCGFLMTLFRSKHRWIWLSKSLPSQRSVQIRNMSEFTLQRTPHSLIEEKVRTQFVYINPPHILINRFFPLPKQFHGSGIRSDEGFTS